MLKIHNSLSGEKEEFKPLRPNEVRMYVCGMTNYDYIHVGHARMLTVFDLIQRYLRSLGYAVTYVRNVTDIDDKIIERAGRQRRELGGPGAAVHRRHARGLRHARIAIAGSGTAGHRVHRPDHRHDEDLDRQGLRVCRGQRRCHVLGEKFPHYGRLSGKKIDDLRPVHAFKWTTPSSIRWISCCGRHAKPGEPAWPSPWGDGRPGWAHRMLGHVDQPAGELFRPARRRRGFEVSASRERDRAVLRRLRDAVRTHLDAQRIRARERGEDVQSLGNFFTVREVLKTLRDPEVLRFFLLSSHYRGPINYSSAQLAQADETLLGLYRRSRMPAVTVPPMRGGCRSFARPWMTISIRRKRWRPCKGRRANSIKRKPA